MSTVTQTSQGPCRANDPNLCPFHGAVLRMDKAHAEGNVEAYFEARTQVEALKKDGFDAREFAEMLSTGNTQPATPAPNTTDLFINNEFLNLSAITDVKDSSPADTPEFLIDREQDVLYLRSDVEMPGSISDQLPYSVRLHSKKPLLDGPNPGDDEAAHLSQLFGYRYATAVRGDRLEDGEKDTPHSVVINVDFESTRRSDMGKAFRDIPRDWDELFEDGSPIRTTRGDTRLVPGLKRELKPTLYYGYAGISEVAASTRAPASVPPGVIGL